MSDKIQTAPTGPVEQSARILGIDTVRGFALLGIFFVNAPFLSMPFGELYSSAELSAADWVSWLEYWFIGVLCTGKFYPLFSILFGAGLAILYENTLKSGRSFGWIYFRRLVVLAAFGIAHIVLLWFGDILLLYSIVGLVMLLLSRESPKVLLIIASVVFSISILLSFGFAALTMIGEAAETPNNFEPTSQTTREMPEGRSPIEKLGRVLLDWNPDEEFDSRFIQLEREIQAQGPFSNAILLRIALYAFTLVFYFVVTIWVIFACFCIGAALTKVGFFSDSKSVWRRRLIKAGFLVGLPISIAANFAGIHSDSFLWTLLYLVGSNVSGLLLALAYLSTILTLVERRPHHPIAVALGQLGRMALTGYLLESLLMSALMSHWGLAWFGTTTSAERIGLVIVIYLTILGFANLWMCSFRYGPMEWLWRSLTYLKWQPLIR